MDQALELRRLAAKQRVDPAAGEVPLAEADGLRILAVTSGKGGVGKTNFTINFAISAGFEGELNAVFTNFFNFDDLAVIGSVVWPSVFF